MSVPQRFGVLRLIGTLLKVTAWIVLVASILLALTAGLAGPIARQFLGDAVLQADLLSMGSPGAIVVGVLLSMGSAGGIIIGVLLMVAGVVLFLSLFAAGENIFLQLAIEENTRMSAALLLRAAEEKASPADPATARQTYYGEVLDR
ncbi:MAG: hypothetical protein DWI57_11220 [Chloroflexi bacterium]|nr:MAG: hypothetical protein DWI57_11220 [Chloroflexota bacterium]